MGLFTEDIYFSVTVTNICPTAKVSAPSFPTVTYDIKDLNPLILEFADFQISQMICGEFTYNLVRKDGLPLDKFVRFDPISKIITI
jgi:hypothetical protein